MTARIIGRVKSGSGKLYEVKWDKSNKSVYVSGGGWTGVGKAQSANGAMTKAEAYVHSK